MKILSLLSQKPSSTGSGTYMTELVKAFDKMGASQAIICAEDLKEKNPYEFAEKIRDLKIYSVDFNSEELPFDIFGMSDVMPYKSLRFRDMDASQLKSYKSAFRRVLKEAMEDFQPDVVIGHHLYLLTSIFIEDYGTEKFSAICHGTDLRQLESHGNLRDEIISQIHRIERAFVLQEVQRQEVIELFSLSPQKVKVIGNGYNPEVFRPQTLKDQDFFPDRIKLIFAGKIAKSKGLLSLLAAIESIKDHRLELDLVGGYGAEEEFEEIRRLASRSRHRVEFLGEVSQEELAELFNQADLFVQPSYYEGLGLVCIEAAACGLPVVVTNTPGLKGYIRSKQDCRHFKFVDLPKMIKIDEPDERELPDFEKRLAQAIEEQIERLENDEFCRHYLKRDLFSWDYVAKLILEEYP